MSRTRPVNWIRLGTVPPPPHKKKQVRLEHILHKLDSSIISWQNTLHKVIDFIYFRQVESSLEEIIFLSIDFIFLIILITHWIWSEPGCQIAQISANQWGAATVDR